MTLLHTSLTLPLALLGWVFLLASLGLAGMLVAVVPALVASQVQSGIARWLPRQLFVFIIGNGMFATLAAAAIGNLLLFTVGSLVLPAGAHVVLGVYVGPILLLAWSEAIVSGMLLSALVIFAPEVVQTFRPEVYLKRGAA
jgi:uncharacterized membrane protein